MQDIKNVFKDEFDFMSRSLLELYTADLTSYSYEKLNNLSNILLRIYDFVTYLRIKKLESEEDYGKKN